MEDVNKRRRISFSLSKLECGPQEINSREIRLHLPFSANWNKRMRQRLEKRKFILKLTFSLPLPSSMLKLPTMNSDALDNIGKLSGALHYRLLKIRERRQNQR